MIDFKKEIASQHKRAEPAENMGDSGDLCPLNFGIVYSNPIPTREGGHCVLKWGFNRTFSGNQDATLK